MRKFFTEPENIQNGYAALIEDAGHITKVLRMSVGDEIIIFDGSGSEYHARLTEISKRVCRAEILETTPTVAEPKLSVALFQGVPKAGKMEQIVQKAVELGVSEIYPVMTDRSVVRLDSEKDKENKAERWNKIAQEAVKQCGRGRVPQVHLPISFLQALERMSNFDLALMPYEELGHAGQRGLKELLQKKNYQSVAVLIGPEGGFSGAEVAEVTATGNPVTIGLGNRILRTETAGSTVLSAIMYENDEI